MRRALRLILAAAASAVVAVHVQQPPRVHAGPRLQHAAPRTALRPDPARVNEAERGLRERLAGDAFSYFRFVNTEWGQRVCEAFRVELPGLPQVRVHGDAHVEQYALTTDARGLDDFDDSALGPPVIDLVRFLGSLDLAARARHWEAGTGALYDAFLDGYRSGLGDRGYLPREPSVVARLRASRTRDLAGYFTWAESLMRPFSDVEGEQVEDGLQRFEAVVRTNKPTLPPGYMRVKRAGWLSLGVGSALTPKVLARVEGPGPGADDDVILEAKQVSDLRGVSCLAVAPGSGAVRVVTGAEHLGRLRHSLLAVVPQPRSVTGTWWVRSWDPSYREVTLSDYAALEELREVAHDAGAQLGAGWASDPDAAANDLDPVRLRSIEPRVRAVTRQLTDELLEEWRRFASGPAAPP